MHSNMVYKRLIDLNNGLPDYVELYKIYIKVSHMKTIDNSKYITIYDVDITTRLKETLTFKCNNTFNIDKKVYDVSKLINADLSQLEQIPGLKFDTRIVLGILYTEFDIGNFFNALYDIEARLCRHFISRSNNFIQKYIVFLSENDLGYRKFYCEPLFSSLNDDNLTRHSVGCFTLIFDIFDNEEIAKDCKDFLNKYYRETDDINILLDLRKTIPYREDPINNDNNGLNIIGLEDL